MAGDLQPLDEKFAIVGPDGLPTLYFIEWAQQRQIDITDAITAEQFNTLLLEYLAAHQLQEGSGIQITPSGNISDSPTIAADVQEILDQLAGAAQGSIIYRNASDWVVLAPGTNGHFLKTQGAGADPVWASAGGGAGGAAWTEIDFYDITASGAIASRVVDVSGYNELLIIFHAVTLAASGWRVVNVSDDGGATYYEAAGDYKALSTTGTISSNDPTFFAHSTNNSGARYGNILLNNLQNGRGVISALTPARATNGSLFTASAAPIDFIKIQATTAAGSIVNTNLTGGFFVVYGR